MQPSLGLTVFFLFSFFTCLFGLMVLKKSEDSQDFFVWLPVSLLTVMCYQAFAAALVSLAGIPVNLLTIGLTDLLPALVLWGVVLHTRQRQKYSFHLWTSLSFCLIILLTAVLTLRQFGIDLTIHYCTMDPGVHLRNAMDIVNKQAVNGMFFGQLHNALFIEVFSPFTEPIWYYKLFILSDVGMFALSGWIFTSLIHSRCKTKFMKAAGIVLLLLYQLGYPLNNMEYGFVYWGTGVSVACLLLFVADQWVSGKIDRRLAPAMLCAGCFGLFACYILFAPAVWIAVFLALALGLFRRKLLFTRRGAGSLACVFLPSGLLATVWYLFYWSSSSSPGEIIAQEGFIFQDLFASFVPFLPFALYGLFHLIRCKKLSTSALLFCVLVPFIAVLFGFAMSGRVSAYYYYKTYNLLWLAVFDLLVCGIGAAAERSKGVLLSYSLVWAMVGGMALSGADRAIHEHKPYMNPEPSAGAFFRLYQFNADNPSWDPMDPGALELFQYVLTHYNGKTVPLVGTQEQYGWYEGIANQRLKEFRFWNYNLEEVVERIRQCGVAVVLTNNDLYRFDPGYWDSLERIYENGSGYLARIGDSSAEGCAWEFSAAQGGGAD